MKTLVLVAVLAVSAISARAGDLWQWAPNSWSYTDNHGRSWSGVVPYLARATPV